MEALEVRVLANQLEVNLDADGKREKLIATPTSRITPELREGLKENKDTIMRDLLLRQAHKFLAESYPGAEGEIGSSEQVNTSYLEGDFAEFRQAVRTWTMDVINRLKSERQEETLDTEAEVFEAFREARDKHGWKEVA